MIPLGTRQMAIGIGRRQFIFALSGAAVCVIGATHRARTQAPPKPLRIGFVHPVSPKDVPPNYVAFVGRLRELGYVEGAATTRGWPNVEPKGSRASAQMVRVWARVCVFSGKGHGHGGRRQHRACGRTAATIRDTARRPNRVAPSGLIRWVRRAQMPGANPTAGRRRMAQGRCHAFNADFAFLQIFFSVASVFSKHKLGRARPLHFEHGVRVNALSQRTRAARHVAPNCRPPR
jgi:hypothetical protein